MSIVRIGTTKKYAEGWESIFGRKTAAKPTKPVAKAKKSVSKPAKKAAAKKKK